MLKVVVEASARKRRVPRARELDGMLWAQAFAKRHHLYSALFNVYSLLFSYVDFAV